MRGCLACLVLALMSNPAVADEASPLGMSYLETKDLRLVYFDPLAYLTPHAVRTFTGSLAWQRRMFGWDPTEPVTILLKDLADYGGASATSMPRNKLIFDVAPLSHAFETYPASERLYSLMNHELIHVVQGDLANEDDRRWRRFFHGKVQAQPEHPETLLYSYLTVPRFVAPRWYIEGSAVFMETWMGGGLGRAQGGYDEMVFRAMVRDGASFPDPLGLESGSAPGDFQGGANAYLYGTRFFTWLAYAYSPQQVVAWIRRDDDSERHYADQFRKVFGLPLERAWQDWIAFERGFQQRNLDAVRLHPITPHRDLVAAPMGSISRIHFDEASGVLYGAFRYSGVVEYVGAVNTRDGSVRRLADIKRAMLFRVASFAYDPATGTAFFTNDNLALRDLMAVDVGTGEERMLLEDARIGEVVFNPADRSLLGVRHENGLATLVRIPHPYDRWQDVHTFPYGVVPYDLDLSPDGGRLSASMSEVNGDQFLRVWELARVLAGDVMPVAEFRFGQSVPESFVFSRDGRYLYGSSYYTGVSNIFRFEVATGKIEAVSNAESGYFRPVPLADGRLVVLTFTSKGFVPAIIEPVPLEDVSAISFLGAELAARHPVVTTWQVEPPRSIDEEKLITGRGPFDPPRQLALDNAFPILTGYRDSVGIGYRFNFADPLGFARLGISAAWTPDRDLPGNERSHAEVNWRYLGWRADLAWNRTDFFDLFGPTKRSRKGFAANVGYDDLLIYDEPRKLTLSTDLAWYDRIDTLPWAQNVPTLSDRLAVAEVALRYSDARRSRGAVDDESGILASGAAAVRNADGATVGQVVGTFDYGWALPLRHSSIWLRTVAGASSGDASDPVANFYFGGFGNNYVDRGPAKRYREPYALPGFGIDEVRAQSFVRPMVEWNLPPLGFESVGVPGLHLGWLRPAVFASALWADPGGTAARKDYSNVGAQVDLRISILHWNEMTLSAGYAVGFVGGHQAGTEWMISLRIL